MKATICILAVLLLVFGAFTAFAQEEEPETEGKQSPELKAAEKIGKVESKAAAKVETTEQKAAEKAAQTEELSAKIDAAQSIRQKMRDLGFRVGKIEQVGENTYSIMVVGWDPDGMSPATKGAVSWDPGEKPAYQATLKASINSNGMVSLDSAGLQAAGISMDASRLGGEVAIIEIPTGQ